jgi:hypothetical protein
MTDAADEKAPAFDMSEAVAKFSEKVDNSRKGRKARHKTVSNATDGRSLRATGRTEHLNFKALPLIRELLDRHVPKGGRSLWLEEAILTKLKDEGVEVDA